jgi:phage/plasmid-like protein (TIGR03299 family)
VTDKYQIVQNKDAFAFTDVLLADYKEQVKYETAGSLAGGKRIWMLARMPEQKILDDAVAPYLVFTTGHDGRHMVRVAITPVRVVCQNTLNLALGQAQRSWSTSHTGNIADKLNDAKNTLDLAVNYMSELNLTASELADKVITEAEFQLVQETLFPMPDNLKAASLATITNVDAQRSTLRQAYLTQDIEKFVGTGWGVIQAVSDMATHQQPSRKGINYQENLFAKTIDGHPMIDKAYEIVNAL